MTAAAVLALQSAGCGTLIYPERRGQTGGQIDPGVAILDAAGLLLFIIPGLVAFGVDFSTGAIYLPGGKKAGADGELQMILVPPDDLDLVALEQILETETSRAVDLGGGPVRTVAVTDAGSLRELVRQAN